MLRLMIPALVLVNLVLFASLMGWVPGPGGDAPDPGRLSRQVNPERLRILPPQPGGQPQPGAQAPPRAPARP